ncbi:trk system potassium uptake protein TrkH [Mobilisporobacter senegalensis]|uniref:Trk system potassium uptake protein TrkH n=1 Tax=Mobilisporobacter senegalensis TaxID=1329262 RepID=A0A3N1XUS0_9FIRM|nr:TrkH family potassium uptake protein [Mobilisporobacter senegalensis]ROR30360.1 trk system potassium uptake protein TrkH [Mobilisporobacter senegalensis]
MNYRLVANILGKVFVLEAALMIPSVIVSLIYGEGDLSSFLITMAILVALGGLFLLIKPKKKKLLARDGMMIVSLAWVSLALFGGLPFFIHGAIPSYIDCIFESVSGFTTTGSSILTDVEVMPKGLLFWRSFTHWFGGMGVLVFFLALLPSMSGSTLHILRAESPGPTPGKLVPKIRDTSKILYGIYFVLTVICTLCLIFAGMPVYDSIVHALGTAGTGGFGIKNNSMAYYNSPLIYNILSVFMIIFGVNFTIYFYAIKRNFTDIKKNTELKLFLVIVIGAVAIITFNTRSMFESYWESFYQAFFQVSSLISTTGYTTYDYNMWPLLSKMILIAVMFTGSCAGSTAGGLKQIRIAIMLKAIRRMVKKLIHPRSVIPIKADGKNVDEDQVSSIGLFCFAYFLIFGIAIILVSFDNHDFETTFTAVLTAISNVGPAFGEAGPLGNFAFFSDFSKIVLSLCMLIGRLEIFPVLLMLNVNSWKKA